MATTPISLSFSFIGAGHLATHLASMFHAAGCRISSVLSRTAQNAESLSQQVGATVVTSISDISKGQPDVVIIAVSDNAIADVASQLHAPNSLVLHTSGSASINILNSCSSHYGVIWPIQSLIKGTTVRYEQLPLCIEGCSKQVEQDIESVARIVTPLIYHLNEEQRQQAHLAASIVSNFGNAINALVQQHLTQQGIDFSMLLPIIHHTADKASAPDLWQQQTGAAARHDDTTMQRHEALLQSNPDLLRLYRLLSDIIQQNCPKR